MDRGRLPYNVDLIREGDSWKIRVSENLLNVRGFKEHRWRAPIYIGPAAGPGHLTKEQAQLLVWKTLHVEQHPIDPPQASSMTIVEFVEKIFVLGHVAHKGPAGRTHYRAILKHILKPEEVLRAFNLDPANTRARLKANPDWPYLSQLALSDARPQHVEKLMLAAQAGGYSMQMVTHIRNVVSAIFAYAGKTNYFHGTQSGYWYSFTGREPKTGAHPLDSTAEGGPGAHALSRKRDSAVCTPHRFERFRDLRAAMETGKPLLIAATWNSGIGSSPLNCGADAMVSGRVKQR